jgi:exonuclease III
MPDVTIRLISWNVAGRLKRLDEQVRFLKRRQPDLVALQEVIASTAEPLRKGLIDAGLQHVVIAEPPGRSGPQKYGELIASRWPIRRLPPQRTVKWPERVLSVIVESSIGLIEVHTTHIPPGVSNDWIKIETLEGIYKRLAKRSVHPRILCGDFNAPQFEEPDGHIITWGQRILKSGEVVLRDPHGRWDRGERNVLEGLAKYDLQDAFRAVNGYKVQQFSWYWNNRIGRRFDHIFAAKSLNLIKCRYLHDARKNGLSDHSPIEGVFRP